MTRPLTDPELDHLLNFVGYGRLDADIWFMGMEEAGGGAANLHIRLKFRPMMDNAEARKMPGLGQSADGLFPLSEVCSASLAISRINEVSRHSTDEGEYVSDKRYLEICHPV
jgi:hypothetical protein